MVDVLQTDAQECSGSRLHDSVPSRPAATSELLGRGAGPQCPDESHRLAGKIIARRLSRAGLMEGVLGFTETLCAGESVKRWMSMPMMFYLGIQGGLVSLGFRGNGKPYYIRRTAQLSLYPTI